MSGYPWNPGEILNAEDLDAEFARIATSVAAVNGTVATATSAANQASTDAAAALARANTAFTAAGAAETDAQSALTAANGAKVAVKNAGNQVTAGASSINFTGSAVATSDTSGHVTVNVTGGGGGGPVYTRPALSSLIAIGAPGTYAISEPRGLAGPAVLDIGVQARANAISGLVTPLPTGKYRADCYWRPQWPNALYYMGGMSLFSGTSGTGGVIMFGSIIDGVFGVGTWSTLTDGFVRRDGFNPRTEFPYWTHILDDGNDLTFSYSTDGHYETASQVYKITRAFFFPGGATHVGISGNGNDNNSSGQPMRILLDHLVVTPIP